MKVKQRNLVRVLLITGVMTAPVALAQTSYQQLEAVEVARLQQGAQTQAQIEQLDDQRLDLVGQYRVVLKQRRDLEKYNDRLRDLIQSQEQEKQSLREQISRVATLERDIVPLMSDMLDALDNFVALDLPFFVQERRERIANLRALMGKSSISNSEKYRRIMEAYQIENDYGRSLETVEAELNGSNPLQRVRFLKVGRLALFYQTLDGEHSFAWDAPSQSWLALDNQFNKPIKQGMRMALEQIPAELLVLPVRTPSDIMNYSEAP